MWHTAHAVCLHKLGVSQNIDDLIDAPKPPVSLLKMTILGDFGVPHFGKPQWRLQCSTGATFCSSVLACCLWSSGARRLQHQACDTWRGRVQKLQQKTWDHPDPRIAAAWTLSTTRLKIYCDKNGKKADANNCKHNANGTCCKSPNTPQTRRRLARERKKRFSSCSEYGSRKK